jgi:hypothetical protein
MGQQVQHIPFGNEPDLADPSDADGLDLAAVEAEFAGRPVLPTFMDERWSMGEVDLKLVAPATETLNADAPPMMTLTPPLVSVLPPPVARRQRRWLRRAAIATVIALIAALSIWGWTEHSSAADWKAQAGRLDLDLASTRAELKQTQATLDATTNDLTGTKKHLTETQDLLSDVRDQLADVTGTLATATAQVADLTEERDSLVAQVGTLANDKAQVEDEREQLSAILATAPAMTAALRACVLTNQDLSLELLDVIEAFPYRSLDKAGRLIDDVIALCDDAFAKTDAFESTLSDLGV